MFVFEVEYMVSKNVSLTKEIHEKNLQEVHVV